MKRFFSAAALLALAAVFACQSGGETNGKKDKVPAEKSYSGRSMRIDSAKAKLNAPESVLKYGNFFFVSNLGPQPDPVKKDGNGYIQKLDTSGAVVADKFISKLDAPKGMAIVGGKLYVTDIDKIKAFDVETGEPAGEIDFKARGTRFLNDLVKKSDTELFVSAMDINKIYTVNLTDMKATELVVSPTPQAPNGLWYDDIRRLLYVVGYVEKAQGKIGVIDLAKSEYTSLAPDFGGTLDGLAIVEGILVTSDWSRKVLVTMDLKTRQIGSFSKPKGMNGPADFYFDAESGEFWVPAMGENAIYVQSL